MANQFTAIIVDDVVHGRKNLAILIKEYLSELTVIASAKDAFEAKKIIEELRPDIVFLDINMGKINGLDLLSSFAEKKFEVIFVTAYDKYAIEALKAGAISYILKPVIVSELVSEVKRVCDFISKKRQETKLPPVSQYSDNLMITHTNGYFFINTSDIIWLEASINYCTIYLNDKEPITISKTLKSISEQLNPKYFVRIHKTYMINLNYVKEYKSSSSGEGVVVLSDDLELNVAVSKRAEFRQQLMSFKKIHD